MPDTPAAVRLRAGLLPPPLLLLLSLVAAGDKGMREGCKLADGARPLTALCCVEKARDASPALVLLLLAVLLRPVQQGKTCGNTELGVTMSLF
jgi:hypothetical protein